MPPINCFGNERSDHEGFGKHIIVRGQGEATPNLGAVCVVAIVLVDELDLSGVEMGGYRIGDFHEVTIGEGDCFLAEHFDKVLMTMKPGERAYIKSKVDHNGIAFTEAEGGLGERHKSNFTFNVTLKSFEQASTQDDMKCEEKLKRAQHHKDKGTELFKKGNIDYAMKRYENALACLENQFVTLNVEQSLHPGTLRLQCHLNLAAALLKKENFNGVIERCTEALKIDSSSVKALFRRGQAFTKLGKDVEAKADFNAVIKVEPQNTAARRQIAAIDAKIVANKKMYQKMFDGKKETLTESQSRLKSKPYSNPRTTSQ